MSAMYSFPPLNQLYFCLSINRKINYEGSTVTNEIKSLAASHFADKLITEKEIDDETFNFLFKNCMPLRIDSCDQGHAVRLQLLLALKECAN